MPLQNPSCKTFQALHSKADLKDCYTAVALLWNSRRARQAQSKAAHDLPGDRDASLIKYPSTSQPKPWVRFGLSGPQMRLRAYWAGWGIIGQPGRLELILLVPPAVEP
jgi:hypothetical protein